MRTPAALRIARTEFVLFLREPVAVFFSLAFPLMLLVFIGSVIAEEEIEEGIRGIDAFLPAMLGLTAANIGIMGLSIHIAENRSRGVLRRFRLSPIRDADFFLAQMMTNAALLVVAMAALTSVIYAIYGVPAGRHAWPLVAAGALTTYVAFSMGLLIAGLRLPVRSIQVLGTSVFFLMFFGSGGAVPRQAFPDWLYTLSEFNPLSHLNDLLFFAYIGRAPDSWWPIVAVAVLAVVANVLTWRTFDWEGST